VERRNGDGRNLSEFVPILYRRNEQCQPARSMYPDAPQLVGMAVLLLQTAETLGTEDYRGNCHVYLAATEQIRASLCPSDIGSKRLRTTGDAYALVGESWMLHARMADGFRALKAVPSMTHSYHPQAMIFQTGA
jgi:hypothetical protein